MKKLTALLLVSLFVAMCIIPSFAASTPSVTAEASFDLVPLDESGDQVVIARILNSGDKVLATITDPDDISFAPIDASSSDELKKAYEELNTEESLLDICPSLANRYRGVFGLKKYYYNSLIVVRMFEIKLSKTYQDMLDVPGNKIEFAVSRVLKPGARIVGICRNDGKWNTVIKEVNTSEKVIITNGTVGTFALVVRKDKPAGENWFWNKIVEIWLDILG